MADTNGKNFMRSCPLFFVGGGELKEMLRIKGIKGNRSD